MNIPTAQIGLLAAGALALTTAVAVGPAQADPSFTPDNNDVVGVGSDTTEFLMQGLSTKYNQQAVTGGRRMASFNATGTANIVLRAGTAAIPRPNGSSAGIDELQANNDVSFARTSRGPKEGDEGTIFFPYAKDRLGYVFSDRSHADKRMTGRDLKRIYTCRKTDWRQFDRPAGHIKAIIPQAGSGTRAFFIESIGMTEDQLLDSIAQRNKKCAVVERQEHDPRPVVDRRNTIAPFSFARYKTLGDNVRAKLNYASKARFNVSRDVYNAIRVGDAGSLSAFFDADSWICTSSAAGRVIRNNGFERLPAGECGVGVPF